MRAPQARIEYYGAIPVGIEPDRWHHKAVVLQLKKHRGLSRTKSCTSRLWVHNPHGTEHLQLSLISPKRIVYSETCGFQVGPDTEWRAGTAVPESILDMITVSPLSDKSRITGSDFCFL